MDLQVITLTYDFLKYLIPIVAKFPKNQRYLIGERIEKISLDILENLIEARYTKNRTEILRKTNILLEKLRYLVRIAMDLKLISIKRYEHIAKLLNQIGVQLGGWLKSAR